MATINSNFPATLTASSDAVRAELNAYQQRWKDAKDVIAAQPRVQSGELKAEAKRRLDSIRDQIRMLAMMGSMGNPKAHVAQIAQLAKELASAVHDYAAACKMGEDTTPQAATPASMAAGPSSDASNSTSSSSAPASSSDAAPLADAAPATSSSAAPPSDPVSAQVSSAIQFNTGAAEQKSSLSTEDLIFIRNARTLAAELKALASQAVQGGGDEAKRMQSKTDEALKSVEKNIEAILTPGAAVTSSVNLYA